MGFSTLLHFGIDLYEAYDDGLFDGFLNNMGSGYPSMYGPGYPPMQGYGYPRFPMGSTNHLFSRSSFF